MSNNNFLRIAGIAGILNMVCWLGGLFTSSPDLSAPTTPLNDMFFYGVGLTGIVFTIGLYLLYRLDAATLNLVAAAISVLGYLVLIIGTLTKADPTAGGVVIVDGAISIGMFLFSWFSYSTRRMPRLLSIIGMIGGVAGVLVAVINQLTGVGTNPLPETPIIQVVGGVIFFSYSIGLLVWLAWTGIVLVSGKYQPRTA